jgi:hypothetical protein
MEGMTLRVRQLRQLPLFRPADFLQILPRRWRVTVDGHEVVVVLLGFRNREFIRTLQALSTPALNVAQCFPI